MCSIPLELRDLPNIFWKNRQKKKKLRAGWGWEAGEDLLKF